ncbi:helix-turn-helix domain-containing protein [Gracilimonas sediminicola]|uniref:Helix-turn-helix domain-containing protein n=1 Tax=Gracilimonas sediminicola TaxID=2952158 RepID=A0A9X2L0E7_9BACT|nr:helix-turn-helix transcriptional regulator [Gracilimonas sediminicola]MCP9290048.1 helix-turn-helix domain-containing protein [Gracilimonas sediminicola]
MKLTSINDRIAFALEKSALNQAELGRRTGVSEGTASRWVTGKSKPKDKETRKLIAEVLQVRLEWLEFGTDPMRSIKQANTLESIKDQLTQIRENLSHNEAREPTLDELKLRSQVRKELDELKRLNDQQIEKLIQ